MNKEGEEKKREEKLRELVHDFCASPFSSSSSLTYRSITQADAREHMDARLRQRA